MKTRAVEEQPQKINPTPQRGESTVPSLTQGKEEKGRGGEDNLAFV